MRDPNTFQALLLLIPLAPLVGFLVLVAGRWRLSKSAVSLIGCLAPATSFVLGVWGAWLVMAQGANIPTLRVFDWIGVEGLPFHFSMDLVFDKLSSVMVLVVAGVGSLIHVYSTGYMQGESKSEYARYFSYLNLFTALMLVLVLGGNLLVLFVGWEGVGLCSYLLIGFWYKDMENAGAGMKAFVVNRIGDAAFLLGIFLIWKTTGTIDFAELAAIARQASGTDLALVGGATVVTAATLLFFIGACGKSAQIPLYVWLPDAMAGPTPVSALIHAATMVTAGVYMIGRMGDLYLLAPTTLNVVAVVGAVTACYAACIAFAQNDIKKVLAYSTVSQLGYMFLAMGLGAYALGIFHLVTHAFFKALLFLGSGAVIHGLHGEQDMRKMGGLKDAMPLTYWVFLIGTLALAGVPPLAGFFSKDGILAHALADASHSGIIGLCWALGAFGALLTAGYCTRMMIMTFYGKPRWDTDHGVHQPSSGMSFALVTLAVLTVLGGLLNLPEFIVHHPWMQTFLAMGKQMEMSHAEFMEYEFMNLGFVMIVVVVGFLVAWRIYGEAKEKFEALKAGTPLLKDFTELAGDAFRVDTLYDRLFVRPLRAFSNFCYKIVDVVVIDTGFIHGLERGTMGFAAYLRGAQSGLVRSYLAAFVFGMVLILGYVLVRSF